MLGIQDLQQIAVLKLIFIDIGTTEAFNNFTQKYPPEKFIYRFRLTNIKISTSMKHLNNTILITCVRLNECKKADVNSKELIVLGVIQAENINNWELLKETSNWINIDLVDYLNPQEASNVSFSFLTESIDDISKFDIYLKNSKNEDIIFEEGGRKIPQFNFTINALYS